ARRRTRGQRTFQLAGNKRDWIVFGTEIATVLRRRRGSRYRRTGNAPELPGSRRTCPSTEEREPDAESIHLSGRPRPFRSQPSGRGVGGRNHGQYQQVQGQGGPDTEARRRQLQGHGQLLRQGSGGRSRI